MSAQVKAATSFWSILAATGLMVIAWYGWRPAFGILETNFWSLNAILVQPGYMLCREVLRHLLRPDDATGLSEEARIQRDSLAAFGAGFLALLVGTIVVWLIWPYTRWTGVAVDMIRPSRLVVPAIANSILLTSVYASGACLVWAIADGMMETARDFGPFDTRVDGAQCWRVAHLSDVHVVGERFGFRIESGRKGPRGNDRFESCLAALDAAHRRDPLDVVLISGDMTDAGRASEWAEFLEILERYPRIAAITSMIPGNHDLSIIDRTNPARLELPWASGRRFRRIRMLSAMERIQGNRALVLDVEREALAGTLSDALASVRPAVAAFANGGTMRAAHRLDGVWSRIFPQVVPPATPDGLGLLLLDTNAEAHFSFTNALGILRAREALGIELALKAFPTAVWIVAIHHHLVEYPRTEGSLAIRIGTALINGAWAVRQLRRHRERIIVMHGHRHVDWIGRCEGVRIISAPSPVMGARDGEANYFHIHTMQAVNGRLRLLPPTRVDSSPQSASER
jgi:hypothetical protein